VAVNASVWVFEPSPKDHDHGPGADELTVNVTGDPTVPLGEAFKNAGSVELGGVPPPVLDPCAATIQCMLNDPDVAVTVAVSVAVSVVTACPSTPVVATVGETEPTDVANLTAVLGSGTPLTFCTRTVTVLAAEPIVIEDGAERSTLAGPGCAGLV